MEPNELENWRKAGKIAMEALEYGKSLVKNGANIREVCDKIDAKIIQLGAKPAWPTQVGMNGIAAHSTPDPEDDAVFDNQLVCLDVGAHIDGCVGDTAATIDLSGKHAHFLKAASEALEAAIKVVKPGVSLGEIGKVIQETIAKHGLVPIRNLSGHGLSQWVIHDSPSVPNYDSNDARVLQKGQIIAIEPFATNGAGMIYESERANIFSLEQVRPVRSPFAREILDFIKKEYNTLPFTTRWISAKFGKGKASLALSELNRLGILHAHPPLIEKNKGQVAVFEKTLYIGDTVEVLTTID